MTSPAEIFARPEQAGVRITGVAPSGPATTIRCRRHSRVHGDFRLELYPSKPVAPDPVDDLNGSGLNFPRPSHSTTRTIQFLMQRNAVHHASHLPAEAGRMQPFVSTSIASDGERDPV